MKIENKKFLIVGGGLSGLSVAYRLQNKGGKVTLFDKGINHSSAIAAGIINPLVFRRMTKSWRIDEFLPSLQHFYHQLEQSTEKTFFHELPIRRLFSSDQERNFWIEKQALDTFTPYMHTLTDEDLSYSKSKNDFGSGRVKASYYVDVIPFLSAIRTKLSENCTLINEAFNYSQLDLLSYKNEPFDAVIFCEGYENKNNPWFGELPLDQTKGQTLIIKSDQLPKNESLNRKSFVLPLEDDLFKIGSTYEWHQSETNITEEARELILSNLRFLTDEPVTVKSQNAGIRPTTRDRRPLMGVHPKHNNYFIFNGLGAKGYMLAPLLSEEFVSYIEGTTTLDKEVNVLRYFKD